MIWRSSRASWATVSVAVLMAHEPTWRWQTRMGLVRWQLDHILIGPALRATADWVLDGGASDHVPVLARIQRPTP